MAVKVARIIQTAELSCIELIVNETSIHYWRQGCSPVTKYAVSYYYGPGFVTPCK